MDILSSVLPAKEIIDGLAGSTLLAGFVAVAAAIATGGHDVVLDVLNTIGINPKI